MRWLGCCSAVALLAGCGQKGPLYLPSPPAPPALNSAAPPASAPVTAASLP
ncbi:MAG: LPS translocon maturation chaperone LptM [Hydrogenophaga sp.]